MDVGEGRSAHGRAGAWRAAIACALALAAFAATAQPAAAITLGAARGAALTATKSERTRGTILFGLRSTIRADAVIREAGRRPPTAGSSRRTMPLILRVGDERAYFFYLDRGAHQLYEHRGRVVLVGVRSGRVRRSRSLRYAPAIDGKVPLFLRNRASYESARYRVASSANAVAGSARAAAVNPLGSFGASPIASLRSAASQAAAARALVAEHSCTVSLGGTPARRATVDLAAGSPVLPRLSFNPAAGGSLAAFVRDQAIARRGCRDILVTASGDGRPSSPAPAIRTLLTTSGTKMREYQVTPAILAAIAGANPTVTFKLMLDGPGSGAFVAPLSKLANILVIASSSSRSQTAFRYLKSKRIAGKLTNNPLPRTADSSFFTTQLAGAAAFAASDAEVGHALTEVAAGRAPSFLAYLIARGFALSRPLDFTADLGATQGLYVHGFTPTAPGGAPVNRAPVATPRTVTTAEDTPREVTLAGSDPDGNPLTFAVASLPAHGTLSGTAPNLTYTPAPGYNGPDAFTFTVSDGSLVSAAATVAITVTAIDDPPVTSASGTLAYTENDPPTAIAPALTVTDPDSATLTGASVEITSGLHAGEDALTLPGHPGITDSFDAASGTLTLSGSATVAAYEAALRDVRYLDISDDPSADDRVVMLKARDAGGFGPAGTRTITVTPVNDPPAITTSAGPLSYTEADPPTAVDAGLVLTDPDSPITGASVEITGNHAAPEDVLALPAQPNITGSYDSATGTLTLSGTDSPAAYEAALRAVTYANTSNNPSLAQRTVTFLASDASSTSSPASRDIAVGALDNAPDVDNSAGALAYTENDPATAIDTSITITDPDSANLTGATVRITGNYVPGEDVLALPAQPNVTAAPFDTATGTLTLSGTATVAQYEAALEAVTYRNSSDDPATATRTVSYQARDAGGFGAADTHAVTVAAVDDPPVAVDDAATVAEDSGASAVAVLTNDTDVDAGPKSIASVTQPANGTVVITGSGTGLTYAPNPNYCNSPPGTTPDTFTYTLTPGASAATVSMTVTCADDAPVAVNDSKTVGEDSGAGAVDVLANDTDIDGGPIAVASVTQPANGTVANNGTDVSYTPNANHCNSPPGTTPDTFTYTLNGGSIATVSVTVTCVDDPPIAVADAATVGEDSGAGAVDVLANDTDVDGGPKSVASVTQPANGAVAITGGGTGVSYAPNANYCNTPPGTSPDTFTYTLNGGSTATVSMTVTCASDAPVVDTSIGTTAYTENAAPTPIDAAVTVTDPDASSITGATVQVTANFAGAQDVLALAGVHPGITAIQIGDTLTLSGTASTAAYQAALRDVTYANSSDSPSTLLRTVTFTVTDDTALTGSDAKNLQVSAADDNPVAVNDATTVGEDSGATLIFVLTNDTDVDGGPIAVSSVTQPANGTVSNNGTDVTYTPNANYCNSPSGTPDTFTHTLTPGGSTATVSVTVTCVADPPNVTTSGGSLAYTENDPATPIDPGATVTDPDVGAMITGATVAITANFAGAQDVLALAGVNPGISAGAQVGNTLTLTGTATPAAYQAALGNVTYRNTSEGPSTLARTVTFTVTDNTALSDSATRGITVAAVNDPPNAVDDSGTTDEDTPLAVIAPGVLANDTDVDPGDTKTVVALNGSGTLTQALPSGASVTINANGSYTYNPLSAFQGLSTGQQASDSFTYTMQDGAGAQDTATVSITINGISDAPTAVADSFDVIGNTGLFVGTTRPATQAGKEISGSLLANDTDPDTPQASLSVVPVSNAPTTLGGTITIESDGNFTYNPDDVDTGVTDTFTYTVTDGVASSTGTLSLPIAGQVWYVRNNEPAGGDGTSDTPFDTLQEAEAASGTGDTVYVFDGSNTTTNLDTGYVMASGERLIGESRPLSLDPDGGGPLPTSPLFPGTSGAQPTLTASNEDVIVLASNVLVDGVDVDPSGTGGGISGGAGVDAVTVQNVNVTDTGTKGTQPGIEMDGTTGVNRFTGVTVTNGGSATAIGVRINNADRVLFANTATNTISTTGAKALDVASTSLLTSRWNDITVTGSGTGAIRLSSTTGQPVLGDGSGTDLSLQTTSGATAALDIASSNTVTVDSAGTDTISATGGPAIDIRNSNGSQYFFDSASSTNSAGDGVNLDTNLTAPVVINGGTIAGAAGIAFDVNGGGVGGGGVVYDGAINDGSGQSVEVTGRDGGGVTFSGNIADSADAGGGIVVSGNSAGSTSFSGASKVLNTGASNAVALSTNGNPANGHLVSFTNGGLDIDTTSGTGFSASNGTVTVGGTGNSITTGTGTALNVDTAGITSGNLNFDSISSNGSTNAIKLFTTGTTGGLNVTGTGGACATTADPCTGGTIQSTTLDAVSLISTQNVTLQRMKIRNSLGNGVRGSSVTNFALRDSVVDNNGDDAATDEAGLHFDNLAGNSEFTRTLVANSPEDNARVVNSSGTLSQLNVTDSTFRDTDTVSPGNDGLLLQADGGSITADVLGDTFLRNRANGLQVITNGTGSMDVEVDDSATKQSTFDDNNIGVSLAHNSSGTFSYGVRDLTIDGLNVAPGTGGSASPINVNLASAATTPMVGKVTGNTVTNSNSTTGPGLRFTGNGSATMTTLIDANTISGVANRGIEVIARDGSNRINATISNNTVTLNNALSADAIRVDAGSVSTDTTTICADIRGNTATTTAVGLFGIRVRQRFAGTTFILEDYAGSPTDDAAVQTFLSTTNNAATTSADHAGAGFTTIADCPTPP